MSVCRWCGTFFDDPIQMNEHEDVHRMIDGLGGNMTVSILCSQIFTKCKKKNFLFRKSNVVSKNGLIFFFSTHSTDKAMELMEKTKINYSMKG